MWEGELGRLFGAVLVSGCGWKNCSVLLRCRLLPSSGGNGLSLWEWCWCVVSSGGGGGRMSSVHAVCCGLGY